MILLKKNACLAQLIAQHVCLQIIVLVAKKDGIYLLQILAFNVELCNSLAIILKIVSNVWQIVLIAHQIRHAQFAFHHLSSILQVASVNLVCLDILQISHQLEANVRHALRIARLAQVHKIVQNV